MNRLESIATNKQTVQADDPYISNQTFTYKRIRLVICRFAKLISRIHTEKPMKKIAILAALAALLGTSLGGCIIVPGDGGYHHHRDYYRY
jgi:hypothetical protein